MKGKKLLISILTAGMLLSAAPASTVSAKGIKTVKQKITIKKGKSIYLTLHGTKKSGKLTVSKKKIVRIKKQKKNKWKVTGIKAGHTKITIKTKKKKFIFPTTVRTKNKAQYKDGTMLMTLNSYRENDIGIQDKNVNVNKFFYMYSNTYTDNDIRFKSSNKKIVKLDQNGNLKPVHAGTATIKATVGSLSAKATVTIHDVTIKKPALPKTVNYSSKVFANNSFTIRKIKFDKYYWEDSHKFFVTATLTGHLKSQNDFCLFQYRVLNSKKKVVNSGTFKPEIQNGKVTATFDITRKNNLSAGHKYQLKILDYED